MPNRRCSLLAVALENVGQTGQWLVDEFRGAMRPKSIFFKGHGSSVLPMPVSARHIATFLALALAGLSVGGCGTINEKIADGMGTYIPQWAGGLPPDAPPRRGTPEYDAYMKEREAKRLQAAPGKPTPSKDESAKAPVSSSAAVY